MKKTSTRLILLTIFIILLVTVFPAAAGTVTTINFEDLEQGVYVRTSYPGLSFSESAWISTYPEYPAFPAHSGNKKVDFYMGNPCTITFSKPVSKVGLWYTSDGPTSIEAYDSAGKFINRVDGDSNLWTTTHLEVTGQHIASVFIRSGTIDDLEYETEDDTNTPPITGIPEFPSVALPVVAILGLMFIFQRKK